MQAILAGEVMYGQMWTTTDVAPCPLFLMMTLALTDMWNMRLMYLCTLCTGALLYQQCTGIVLVHTGA